MYLGSEEIAEQRRIVLDQKYITQNWDSATEAKRAAAVAAYEQKKCATVCVGCALGLQHCRWHDLT